MRLSLFYLGEWRRGANFNGSKEVCSFYVFIKKTFVSRVTFSNGSGREKEKKRNLEKSERRKKDLAKENRDLR